MNLKYFYFLTICFLLVISSSAAGQTVRMSGQLNYPQTPNGLSVFQGNRSPLLPDYIEYIFTLIIMVSGLIILWVIISSGFDWYTSAGNAGKIKEAKDRIFSSFVGVIVLFLSFLILKTINPTLTSMSLTSYSAGISVGNSLNDKIIAPYFVTDLTTLNPAADKITIPYEKITSTKIFFFKETFFHGQATEASYNWSCPDLTVGYDIKKIECTMPFPSEYAQGSLITYELKPGVYLYKRTKDSGTLIPFYIPGSVEDVSKINGLNEIEGDIIGLRIYNGGDPNTSIGVVAWGQPNYMGVGFMYFHGYKQGFLPEESDMHFESIGGDDPSPGILVSTYISYDDKNARMPIKSVKTIKITSRRKGVVDIYSEPEARSGSKCQLIDQTSEEEKKGLFSYFKIDCSNNSNQYPSSISANNITYVLLKKPENSIHSTKGYASFERAEIITGSDANLNDNAHIGQCVCKENGIFGCTEWQSCATHVLTIPSN